MNRSELAEARERLKQLSDVWDLTELYRTKTVAEAMNALESDVGCVLAALDRAGEALGPFSVFADAQGFRDDDIIVLTVDDGSDWGELPFSVYRLAAQVHQDLTGGGERG